ncbi:MAG: diadenylate cyclase CdaA [bacterium]
MPAQTAIFDYFGLIQSLFKQNSFWFLSNLSSITNIWSLVDIAIVSFLIYWLFIFFRGTKAFNILVGFAMLGALAILSQVFNLVALAWILKYTLTILVVAIPVVFQPELRNALEQIGRTPMDGISSLANPYTTKNIGLVNELSDSILSLAEKKHGALIVFERQTGLREYSKSGVKINANLVGPLLKFIFNPQSPFHDGAAIIVGNKVKAVSCTLPLTEKKITTLGLRHKSAIGMTEQTDATIILVSEQRGKVFKVSDGKISEALTEEKLKRTLKEIYPEQSFSNPIAEALHGIGKFFQPKKPEGKN